MSTQIIQPGHLIRVATAGNYSTEYTETVVSYSPETGDYWWYTVTGTTVCTGLGDNCECSTATPTPTYTQGDKIAAIEALAGYEVGVEEAAQRILAFNPLKVTEQELLGGGAVLH